MAFTIVLCTLDPVEVNATVGYSRGKKGPGGLWRILLQGSGYGESVKEKAAELVAGHKEITDLELAKWQRRLTEHFGEDSTAQEEPTAEEVVSWDELAAIFARNITAATAAGSMLLSGGETAKEAALSATRDGLDLQELKELIDRLL